MPMMEVQPPSGGDPIEVEIPEGATTVDIVSAYITEIAPERDAEMEVRLAFLQQVAAGGRFPTNVEVADAIAAKVAEIEGE